MKIIINSRLLGEIPSDENDRLLYLKNARDIAIRFSVFHEASHVLQRAFLVQNAPYSARIDQHVYLDATQTLLDLDNNDRWKWSRYDSVKQFEELTRTQESQAEGIAFEVLTSVYDMNHQQKDILWSHFFGRLDPNWELISNIKSLFENNWNDMSNKAELANVLDDALFASYPNAESSLVLKQLLRSATDLPKDAGYNDPMTPQEAEIFWKRFYSD